GIVLRTWEASCEAWRVVGGRRRVRTLLARRVRRIEHTGYSEGWTLAQALHDAGVPENISVRGENGDPNSLIVCDHDPDGVAPTRPVTLEVATSCPEEDPDREKRKKRSSGGSEGKRR
ncbi:MAG TPA: hypothetical protein VHF46_06155, partial [Rubrobacteraceae bacterium]|nr:hypothetical protein [Rubrobacteraceae bacterium]